MKKILIFLALTLLIGVAGAQPKGMRELPKDKKPAEASLFSRQSLKMKGISSSDVREVKPATRTFSQKKGARKAAVFSEDFEGTINWTVLDSDGDENNWSIYNGANYAHSGSKFAGSASWTNTTGPLNPDNWLISPQITIPSEGLHNLSFWVSASYGQETYDVLISTTNTDVASFTSIHNAALPAGEYENVVLSLEDYAGEDIYIAFRHHDSYDNEMLSLDDIEVVAILETPTFDGPTTLAFGNVYHNLNSGKWTATYTVTNKGLSDLTVDVSSKSAELTITAGFPMTVPALESKTFTVELDASALSGAYAGSLTLTTNDPENGSPVIDVTANVNAAAVTDYVYETFDSKTTLPKGWAQVGFGITEDGGVDNSKKVTGQVYSIYGGMFGYQPYAILQTCWINLGSTPEMSFQYRVTDDATTPTEAENFLLRVAITDDYGKTWKPVQTLTHTPSLDYAAANVDLSAYAGKTVQLQIRIDGLITEEDYVHSLDLDNIEIKGTKPVDPVFDGALSASLGTLYNNLPDIGNMMTNLPISNTGTNDLVVSLASKDAELAIEELPLTVPFGETKTFSIGVDPEGMPIGRDTFDLVLTTNDPNQTSVAIKASVNVQAALIKSFLFEDFTAAGVPEGWTAAGFARTTTGGVDNSAALRANLYSSYPTRTAATCYVNMGTAPKLSFKTKFIDYEGETPTSGDNLSYYVLVSSDFGRTFDTVLKVLPGEHVAEELTAVIVDDAKLTEYANKLCFVKLVFNSENENADFYAYVDDVLVGTMPANDLSVTSFTTQSAITELNKPAKFQAIVRNEGSATQSSWSVKLMDEDETELVSVSGTELTQYKEDTVEFTYTPTTAGMLNVYAFVDFSGDEYPVNNQSKDLAVKVLTEDEFLAEVGTGTGSTYVPCNFYYNKSLHQAIYYPAELGTNGGELTSIVYKSKFATAVEGKTIQVWVGETDSANLSGGFIDPATLTKVFDGAISIPAGDYDLEIPLTAPYEYGGKNLVVYTAKIDDEYVAGSYFYATTQTGSQRSILQQTDDGELDPENPGTGTVSDLFPNTRFVFDGTGLGSIAGVVNDGTEPLEGVSVKLTDGEYATTTDEDGSYSIPHRTAGTYNIEVSKIGYLTDTVENLALNADEDKEQDITMTGIPKYIVSGKVTGNDGSELEGVTVKLSGYNEYEITTDASGDYSISDVYAGYTYDVTATIDGYQGYTSTVEVATDNVTKDIVLIETLNPAIALRAELQDNEEVKLTWADAADATIYSYDNGIATGPLGLPNGTAKSVMGSAHNESTTLYNMSWYTIGAANAGGPHDAVNVFVLALDAAGEPTSTVLYSAMDVPNTDDQWMTYDFPQPVEAPNGFFIGISYTGFLGIGTAAPDNEHPFENNTQFFTSDYTAGFVALENNGGGESPLYLHFMVRATGIANGSESTFGYSRALTAKPAAMKNATLTYTPNEKPIVTYAPANASKALTEYVVYRLTEGQEESAWTTLSTTTTKAYTDNTFAAITGEGLYQYAVKAKYSGDHLSAAVLSNTVPKGLEVAYTVNVTTNSEDPAEGAVVTLTNQDGDAAHVYTQTATASAVNFAKVWKGTYDISIEKAGFEAYSAQDVAINAAGLSHDAELTEIIDEPYNLLVDVQGNTATLSWNNADNFSDDMEGYSDFIITNIGDYILHDGDEAPGSFGIQDVEFQNTGYQGSWIVFNPSKTTPSSLNDGSQPHSGDKFLACFGATDGTAAVANNDWLILPKKRAVQGTKFEFWAKSFSGGYLENMKVAVSTTGTAPADFTVISAGSSVTVPAAWTKYTYDLSNYAGQEIHVAINCVSFDKFALFVDDIFLGKPTKNAQKSFSGYTVYLNDVEKATGVTETEYTFTDLEKGDYVAGVKAVYSSNASEIVTQDFTIEISSIIEQITGKTLKAWIQNEKIHISGLPKGQEYRLYNVLGTLIYRGVASSDVEELPCTLMHGTYIIQSGKHSVKMAY